MKIKRSAIKRSLITTICLAASIVMGASVALAQPFSIPWFSMDGGGGYSRASGIEHDGTVGQVDAGPVMTGGGFELTGGFWAKRVSPPPVQILPDSLLVTRGNQVSGDVAEISVSDNMDLSLQRANADIQSRTEFVVQATSPVIAPGVFEFTLEGSVFARSNVVQTIEFFDYDAGVWELVSTTNASRSPSPDSVVNTSATGDLSRFVEPGTQIVEARIRYRSNQARLRFASNTDLAIWTIGQ